MASFSSNVSKSSYNGEADYLNLDDILASQEKVPCTFTETLENLGYLDHSSVSENIEKGVKMELPFWLAIGLSARRQTIVDVQLPKVYRESYRQILEADATVVDLNKLGPYYYLFGGKLLDFITAENPRIAESLISTYLKRVRKLMDLSQSNVPEQKDDFLTKLDEVEKHIFTDGQTALRSFEQWKQGVVSKLTMSKSVTNHRKRKRTEDN